MKLPRAFYLLTIGGFLSPLFGQTVKQDNDQPDTASQPPTQTYGRIEGSTYISPTGVFKMKIPVLPQLGGTVADTPNSVTFDDDYSIHVSVGAFPLTQELKWEFEKRGTKDFLVYFFTNIVMPDFAARCPGAQMEQNATFIGKYQDGTMLIFTLLPGGSFFEQRARFSRSLTPVVAKRGNLCFVKYAHVFVVTTELAERALERSAYKKPTDEENAILRKRLMDVVGKMQFIEPAPQTKG